MKGWGGKSRLLAAVTMALPAMARAQGAPPSGSPPVPPASGAPAQQMPPPPPASPVPAATSAPPVSPASAAPAFIQSAGTPVDFDATRPFIRIFVAPGILENTGPVYPDPFFKIGRTPVAVRLVPGVYTVNAESPEIPSASTILRVGSEPVHVRVKAGSDGMRGLGTLLIAAGAACLLAATVIELSYSPAPNGISKSQIAVPLFVVGGVGVASGLTFYLVSGTTFEQDGAKQDRRGAAVAMTSFW